MTLHDFQMILSISNTTLIISQNFDVNFDIISRSLIAYARGINFIVLALIWRTEEPVTSKKADVPARADSTCNSRVKIYTRVHSEERMMSPHPKTKLRVNIINASSNQRKC